jgi:hypothetical protein
LSECAEHCCVRLEPDEDEEEEEEDDATAAEALPLALLTRKVSDGFILKLLISTDNVSYFFFPGIKAIRKLMAHSKTVRENSVK